MCSPPSATARDTVPAIAAQCKASERGIRILCDYLTIIGFLTKTDGRYQLTLDSSVFLSKRSPAYFGSVVGVPRRAGRHPPVRRSRRHGPARLDAEGGQHGGGREPALAEVRPRDGADDDAAVAGDRRHPRRCGRGPDARARHRGGARHLRHRDRAAQSAGGDCGGRLGRRAAGRDRERREDGRRRRAIRRWPATRSRSTSERATTSR